MTVKELKEYLDQFHDDYEVRLISTQRCGHYSPKYKIIEAKHQYFNSTLRKGFEKIESRTLDLRIKLEY